MRSLKQLVSDKTQTNNSQLLITIDVLRPLLCTWEAKWAERPQKLMRRSQRWNNLQICPRRYSNTINDTAPEYRKLRSSSQILLQVPVSRLKSYGDCAFSERMLSRNKKNTRVLPYLHLYLLNSSPVQVM